jgi:acetyl-CoA acetyltransferase
VSDAFITAAVRTPIGRAGGVLAEVRPDDLAAAAVAGLVRTARLPVDRIDDVILGCANQAGEDNRNVARMAVLLAGLPVEIPGQTVNRLCGSGMQAVVSASHAIRAGEGELFVAGGVESMTRAPYVMLKPGKAYDRTPPPLADSTVGWRFVNPRLRPDWTISLGETAERVAGMYKIDRAAQDAFAAESQRRAQQAIASVEIGDEGVRN